MFEIEFNPIQNRRPFKQVFQVHCINRVVACLIAIFKDQIKDINLSTTP
jgi:hypothetical protein